MKDSGMSSRTCGVSISESEEILESVKFNYIMTYRRNGIRGKQVQKTLDATKGLDQVSISTVNN